ncbi:MAG: energy-coupling factor transporter transmembrane protein EcfT [Deltaproteobacteria bacterium]|jgi:cobalt/nickel transport system permease protein|nr:energy-coupling factor transporter transmembrane protein EcfT [Deltaproteobacteria bacterium]
MAAATIAGSGFGRDNFLMGDLDPRIRILALFLWSVLLAILKTRDAALVGLAGSLALGFIAGTLFSLKSIMNVLGVNAFLIFIWLFLPFSFGGGEPVFGVFGFEATREGVDLSILISLKALAITFGAAAILSSAPIYGLLAGARAMGVPEKVVALMMLMSRYIQVVGDEYSRLRNAMRIRGFRATVSRHALRSVANLCGMLLVRGFERADRVLAAMMCRGYKGRFWLRPKFTFKAMDLFFLVFLSLLILAVELEDAA